MKVLLIGSNYKGMKEVLIGREIKKIREILISSEIHLIDAPDSKRDELYERISEIKPQIIHFSGHGTNETGPLFNGDEYLISTPPPLMDQLIEVLKKGKQYVKLVIFNVCDSLTIAEKTSGFIDFTIGIEKKAEDRCVRAFSKGFYRILLRKDSLNNAYDNGTNRFSIKHTEIKADGLKQPYQMFSKNSEDEGVFIDVFGEISSESVINERRKKIISKLIFLQDKIHSNYPFETIKVRYLDSNFYNYMNKKYWNRAKNQIVYKLKKEIKHLNEIFMKILSIRTFLGFKNRFTRILESKKSKLTSLFNFSPDSLMFDMVNGSEQSRNSYKRMLGEQFYNVDYLAGNLNTCLSNDGIYIFLDDNYRLEADKIKNYFSSRNKFLNENIFIILDGDDISFDQILETSCKLIEKIDSEQIEIALSLLGKINKILEDIKGFFEEF